MLFASFSGKGRTLSDGELLSGASPRPRSSASRRTLEKEEFYQINSFLGPAPDPVAPLRGELVISAKQNNRFLLLFLEKEELYQTTKWFSGASPRPRGSASRRIGHFCKAKPTLFASFSGKRRIWLELITDI
jgi:hypothetical protein